jgi:hypothetical protein
MYTQEEKNYLKSLAPKGNPRIGFQEVEPWCGRGEHKVFVKNFLKRLGIKCRIKNAEVYGFHNVGMHRDTLYGENSRCMIFPIKGRGALNHMGPKEENYGGKKLQRIYQTDFHALGKPIIFNDHQPHSFISRGKNCFAIIAEISKQAADKLKESLNGWNE